MQLALILCNGQTLEERALSEFAAVSEFPIFRAWASSSAPRGNIATQKMKHSLFHVLIETLIDGDDRHVTMEEGAHC